LSIDLALRYYLIPIPDLIDIGKIHEGNILEVVYSELISIDDVMKTGLISDALAEKLGWEEVKGVWRGSIRFIEGHT
ncbi:MAG: hypothetical protein GY860_20835, partial [Desulfobacteraceae bacterium]|nr:hypothetical protein [Desulfobacteraceae bacterium]